MFKPGFIRKINVRNFVTYDYAELYPGPHLNMIVGPNGTGKSTMVAAIILGLGGSPKVVGRGTRISEYVKHGCEFSVINVYLQQGQENSYLQITREFDTSDKTSWKINNRQCSFNDVLARTKEFNIQVDNLCQFLPQDRVADFAKLNKKDLLKQTQLALCRDDLIDKQNSLIKIKELHSNLLKRSKDISSKLQDAADANSRLEGKVISFNKMCEYKERIKHVDRKIAWTIYEEKRAQLGELKNDKSKANEVLQQHKNEMKPMEMVINQFKQKYTEFLQVNSKTTHNIRNKEENIDLTSEKIDKFSSKIREIEDEIRIKLSEIDQWNHQIEIAVTKLEDMKKLQDSVLIKIKQGDSEKLIASKEINTCTTLTRQLRAKKEQTEQDMSELKAELGVLKNEYDRIQNVKQARLEQLRRTNEDAYRAVLWLRNNKHLFQSEIFEPILLELNILDTNQAKYVESMILLRDKVAFTCTNKNDMNLLIKCLREQQGLSVNVLHSDPQSNASYQSNIPIEHLRKYGFYTYVNMLFTAPEPIVHYLCQTYRLHNIPVGDHSTNACYEQVPKQLTVFFSDKFRYKISFSKYTEEKSTSQNGISGDGGFSLSLDIVRLENIKGRCVDMERRIQELRTQVENADAQIIKLDEKGRVYREKLMEIQKQKQQADLIKNRILEAQQNLNSMRNTNKNPEIIRQEGRNKLQKLVEGLVLVQGTLKNQLVELKNLVVLSSVNSLKIEWLREKIECVENDMAEKKGRLREAEELYNAIADRYSGVMQEAKAQLLKAKELSDGLTPADDGFDKFRDMYDQLSSNLEELNAQKENIDSRIACLNTADDGEIKEYENRCKAIDAMAKDSETLASEIEKIEAKMDRKRKEWLDPLSELVTGISKRFSTAFELMGCAGEISITHGDDERNFADYSLSIKVTYRNGEPLQELNATVQSGGERAVATAVFMLALQELTPVPFRCVDEINQGMDANNERRVFELIVETTCQENTSQYFLITPKLVPNLRYPKQMMVHFIHNGPFVNADRKWSYSKLCNPQGVR
ncbi:structural maintenance of chromosomes protein 5 [Sitophilus oryzae]|uniref:Structural maintenance of chromosomes protein 5 n=1 Tax=Sitophilus oryzae TaxID=7048 RepID=A0A6J2Y4S4_SITOR|nr:structural maintenance of chromosomes protein 5 [Sitophilus oryzae]